MNHLLPGRASGALPPHVLLLIGAVVLLWTTIEGLGFFLPDQTSSYQVVWMRYAVHLLFLVVCFGPRYRSRLWRTRRLPLQIGRGFLMFGMPVCFILSVRSISPETTWAIFWLAPLLALALAALLLRETVRRPVWLATAAAYVGVLLVLQPPPGLHWSGVLLAFGMSMCFVLYLLLSRLLRDEPLLPSLFYTAVGVLIPLSLRLPNFWQPLHWRGALLMALIGLLGLLLLACLDKVLELSEIGAVTPFLLATPIGLAGLTDLFGGVGSAIQLFWGSMVIVSSLLSLFIYYKHRNSVVALSAARSRQGTQ